MQRRPPSVAPVADGERAARFVPGAEPPLTGSSPAMEELRGFVARVGPMHDTVAIFGEVGSGKELLARHLHGHSPRAEMPFVVVDAATLPEDRADCELFGEAGHDEEPTQFHGAFLAAASGTLFIDNVDALPLGTQAKLVRALGSRVVRPVGAHDEVPVDVRVIVATCRDLAQEAASGRFREDLYFRLQVFPVTTTPLAVRQEDVVPTAEDILSRLAPGAQLSPEAKAVLKEYAWPGNVRELWNVLRRASLFAKDGVLSAALIQRMLMATSTVPPPRGNSSVPPSLAEVERAHIESVLAQMGGNVTQTAQALGIDRRTLQRKMRSFGLGDDGTE